jgi:hypothetical protein
VGRGPSAGDLGDPRRPHTLEQLADNLGAAGVHLDEEETALLDRASDPDAAGYPYGGPGVEQRSRRVSAGR